MKRIRLVIQLGMVVAAAVVGIRFAAGQSLTSVEKYCPFGGLETAYSFLTRQRFSCAAGELNLALFLALAGLALVARKAFCGWGCPVGALLEWQGRLSRRLFRRPSFDGSWRLPPRVEGRSKALLRAAVLAVVLGATWATGELVFRGYDPYYILFSANGHDVRAWSYLILAALAGAGLFFPLAWCKYLCPLGACLWPLAAAGRLRLVRDGERCTGCGTCDRVCPQGLAVSAPAEVRSGDCTLCLECTAACPSAGALELTLKGFGA